MKKIINIILIGLGFLFVGIGILGVVLPVFPTTPFLILSALCFAKGSERFHIWFLSTTLYKKYVGPAVTKKAMDKTAKIKMLCVLCVIFTASVLLVPVWPVKVLILLIALFHGYYFTFKIKTLKIESILTQINTKGELE